MVMGPTPPGTGVIQPARSLAPSKSTSPTSLPSSVRLMPTSMTMAPCLIQSPGTICGRPTAATSTSALRALSARSLVRLWQTVMVQRAASSSRAMGRPTILDWPMMTASRPFELLAGALQQGHDALGRAGAQHGHAQNQPADVVGVEAVHVLGGQDALDDRLLVDLIRQRQLDQDAVDLRPRR